ncbi:sensor histidine kinase [Actinoallomurus rhizosphaericola]|uniref:sensor histidine kinase n=1 Tax=Actinoallomurus rhizosphaericola TaxID=2952536 RepID=UPI00209398AC|nr:sensor histidine kinase [Actinoallomurus rhizosphaericola]MCO5997194.1 sensor domain-containing protein [Actinoallomurus rhizosphaericola]
MADGNDGALRRALRDPIEALARLVGGLGTATLALLTALVLIVVGVLCLVGVGLPLLPWALAAVRAVADRERERLSRWGEEIISPYDAWPSGWSARLRAAARDPATTRDLRWLFTHAVFGLVLGLFGALLPLLAIEDLTRPLYSWALPPGEVTTSVGISAGGWTGMVSSVSLGAGWVAILVGLGPAMARLQARPGRRLLAPHPSIDLSARVAELTATRAAALDAHTAELRRIERSLHDGTQNRLVGVVVLLGAARRALKNDPALADGALEQAQSAAEQALAELRAVVRGILPPVLEQRGLGGALAALAAGCAVPCRVSADVHGSRPASVDATAYFVVAEALTNISKHSHARHATVEVRQTRDRLFLRVEDDGRGGADENAGSGVVGIRRRVEAHDGHMTLTSPPGGPTVLEVELPCVL